MLQLKQQKMTKTNEKLMKIISFSYINIKEPISTCKKDLFKYLEYRESNTFLWHHFDL